MGMHRSEGATALLGMDEFVVGAHDEVDGEVWLMVETTADAVGCEACGTRAVGHGRRVVRVRDLPAGDRPVVLVWRKRIWRCLDPDCVVRTWTEETDAIAPRAVLTERARAEVCRRVGAEGHSVPSVARALGVGWHTAMEAVRDHGRPRVDHLSRLRRPTVIGLDETTFVVANAIHPTLLITGFVDLDRNRLIDVVAGRDAEAVSTWLRAKPPRWLAGIVVAVIDPYAGLPSGWPTGCPTLASSSTTSTPCASPTRLSTRCGGGSSRTRQVIVAASSIPSTGSAADCPQATSGSARTAGHGLSRCSISATPPGRSARPTWRRSCCATCTPRPSSTRPAAA